MVRGVIPRQPARSGRHEGRATAARATQSRGASRQPRTGARKAAPLFPKTAAKSPGKAIAAPKGYQPTSPQRVSEILKRLDQTYPGATCALHHGNAWELLVATILSAQCTDVRVNMTTPELFRKYPTPQAFAALKPEQLEPDIRSTGFFRNKSKSLVGAAKGVVDPAGNERCLRVLQSLRAVRRQSRRHPSWQLPLPPGEEAGGEWFETACNCSFRNGCKPIFTATL